MECESDSRARHQAALALTEMAHEYIPNDGARLDLTIQVRSLDGIVFTFRLDFETDPGPALRDLSVLASHHRS